MIHFSRLLSFLFFTFVLISCAAIQKDEIYGDGTAGVERGSYRFDAWRLNTSGDYEAINLLLDEVDQLIESDAYNAAADKLERVLRIKPQYAPAWSRLSWLALQMDSPARAVQMAKRSNSFAYSDPELQALNWSFIRDASKAMNDEKNYYRANEKIESLKVF